MALLTIVPDVGKKISLLLRLDLHVDLHADTQLWLVIKLW